MSMKFAVGRAGTVMSPLSMWALALLSVVTLPPKPGGAGKKTVRCGHSATGFKADKAGPCVAAERTSVRYACQFADGRLVVMPRVLQRCSSRFRCCRGLHSGVVGISGSSRWCHYQRRQDQDISRTATVVLGRMYETMGKGCPEDDVQAYAWLNIAADQGNEFANAREAAYH